ncbi:unnamed protein product [Darwinula stevensoni]|uniref:Ionotropic glutamate receptor C-terminal domain-containing protein n=1 Tax=Darwinula stevensoni TaxID=69355 RepID=A0A7R8XEC7_9CRUS|nr:unnamed protein product [Darwinula stevensoni]CAG0894333.1 unnamed protein product [Darwinula stevensoni]
MHRALRIVNLSEDEVHSSRTQTDSMRGFFHSRWLWMALSYLSELPNGDFPYPTITYACKDHVNDAFQDMTININDVHLLTFCTPEELRNLSVQMDDKELERVRWKMVSLGVNGTDIEKMLSEESRVTLVQFESDGSLSLRTTMPELRDRGYYFQTKGHWRPEAGFDFLDCQTKEERRRWRCMFYDSLASLDFQGALLHVSANDNPPFIKLNGTTPVFGIDYQILLNMQKAFNFTSQAIDFSRGYFYQALTFVTQPPTEKSRVLVVLQPFSPTVAIPPLAFAVGFRETCRLRGDMSASGRHVGWGRRGRSVWGLFAATIFVSTIFLHWFTGAELQMGNRKWHVHRASVNDSFFLILELLAVGGTDPAEKPRSHTVRVLYATCLIGTVVITGVYSGILTAFMSFPGMNKPLETLAELKDVVTTSSMTWGILGPGTSQMTLFKESEEGLYKELWDSIKDSIKENGTEHLFSSTDGGIKRVLGGGFAFIHPRMSLMYNIKTYGYNNFYMASDQFYFQGSGIAMRKGSPYKDKIDELIIQLQSGGLIGHWASQLLPPEVRLLTVTDRSDSDERPIKIEDLQGAFYILVMGYVMAAMTFLMELVVFSCKKRKELLRREQEAYNFELHLALHSRAKPRYQTYPEP